MASEAETHFKMKRKEKIVKEEQVSHLLETHRVRIEAMIGTGMLRGVQPSALLFCWLAHPSIPGAFSH